MAGMVTLMITTAITIYAGYANINYRIILGLVIMISLAAMTMIIVALVSMSSELISVYCVLAVILYGLYLAVITKMIIGGDEDMIELLLDNYVMASILLYLYVVKIFLMMLRMFASFQS
jgi:FtsH-binding integral membrane protein